MIRIIFTLCMLALSANKLYAMESQSKKLLTEEDFKLLDFVSVSGPKYQEFHNRYQEFYNIVTSNENVPEWGPEELSKLFTVEEIRTKFINVVEELNKYDTQYNNIIKLKDSILKLMEVLERYCSEKGFFNEDGNTSFDAGYIYPEYGRLATKLLIRIDNFYKSIITPYAV